MYPQSPLGEFLTNLLPPHIVLLLSPLLLEGALFNHHGVVHLFIIDATDFGHHLCYLSRSYPAHWKTTFELPPRTTYNPSSWKSTFNAKA